MRSRLAPCTALLFVLPAVAAAEAPPSAAAPSGREVRVELVVKYADNVIGKDKVHLRSYNGGLVGPTMRVRPGDTLNVHLANQLPPNPATIANVQAAVAEMAREVGRPMPPGTSTNVPHDFNTTNLHTHGLHVSPAGNSDNVLLAIGPGESFDYEIKIPPDHPPGTFWYHPHVHGSTSMQVGSGMEGALIVEGDIDRVPAIAAAKEQILVFQQIAYATSDGPGEKKGTVESFNRPFLSNQWAKGQNSTLISGQLMPVFEMQPGEVQRFRLIDAGVEETVSFKIIGPDKKAVPQHLIAMDGITTGKIEAMDQTVLYPGYRADVLIKAPDKEGDYAIIDEESPGDTALRSLNSEARKPLGTLRVKGARKSMELPTVAELAPLAPYKSIADAEVTGKQEVHFGVVTGKPTSYPFAVNGEGFDPGAAPRKLRLGGVDDWKVSSETIGPHIFHIHINPFEVIEPDGRRYWKDTLFVKSGATVKLRTRYVRYVGRFVLHCHILPHEDLGMMQQVEVVPPTEGHHMH